MNGAGGTGETALQDGALLARRHERTFLPETQFAKVFCRARLYLAIDFAVVALAVATRSVLPLLFVGLPGLFGSWLGGVYG